MLAAMAIEVIVWFYLIIIMGIALIAAVLVFLAGRWVKGALENGPTETAAEAEDEPTTAMDGGGEAGKHRPRKRRFRLPNLRDPLTRTRWLFGGGVAVIMILAANAVIIPLSSSNVFCGRACHNMNPEYQTWSRSSHSKVTCTACHVDPTLKGLAYEKIVEGPLGLLHTIQDSYEKPFNPESHYSQELLPKVRCERCHANENRRFTFAGSLIMDHKAHSDAGLDCTVCHNRVTHLGAEEYEPLKSTWEEAKDHKYKNFLTMKDGCFRCHSSNLLARDENTLHLIKNERKPPGACTTCHTTDFKKMPAGHAKRDWRDVHGQVAAENFEDCLTCHEAGAKYDYDGKAWCLVCHDKKAMDGFRERLTKS